MFELLSVVCTAAVLAEGTCLPSASGHDNAPRPDAYEMQVESGMHHLSYSGSGHDFDVETLKEHWRRRATQLCAGEFTGHPLWQTHAPDPGFDTLVSYLPAGGNRAFNVEVYGVAYCADAPR